MEVYILKSAAILAILFVFYKLFLENTSIHTFKRFYLLGIIIISFLIPFITFTNYVEVSPVFYTYTEETPQIAIPEAVESINYWPFVLWTIYGLGVLFFCVKFFRNLFVIIQQIRTNPKYRNSGFINILLSQNVIPHTFFNYIFLNKKQFEKGEIPSEVILHEQTHAIQKHSLDVIFVELLQIVFWFNPLFYFLKRSIKLNHEFLADRAVLNAGAETSEYQKILLSFSSNAFTPALAHSINYLSIKKRFTAMKAQTSKRAIWLRSLLLLPLVSILIYEFSTTQEIAQVIKNPEKALKDATSLQKITLKVFDNKITLNQKEVALADFSDALNAFTQTWDKEDFNLYELDIQVENTLNDFREKINTEYRKSYLAKQSGQENPIIVYPTSENKLISNSNEVLNHLNEAKKNGGLFYYEGNKITFEKAKSLVEKNPSLNIATQNPGLPNAITTISKSPINFESITQKATKAEIAEFNKLAKKYNAVAIEKRVIPLKDLKVLETIYKKMTDVQKANAQPFPECLPPTPPATPTLTSTKDNGSTLNISRSDKTGFHFNTQARKVTTMYYYEGNVIPSSRVQKLMNENKKLRMYITEGVGGQSTVTLSEKPILGFKEKSSEETKVPSAENRNLYMAAEAPPAPNANKLEYIKELAKKGATFYIGPHKYTSDEAIEMVKKSTNEVTIDVSQYPIVKLNGC